MFYVVLHFCDNIVYDLLLVDNIHISTLKLTTNMH